MPRTLEDLDAAVQALEEAQAPSVSVELGDRVTAQGKAIKSLSTKLGVHAVTDVNTLLGED